jgi:diaminopimelate epimerase
MTTYRLLKYHGLGNDFLVLLDPAGSQPINASLARAVCDRHRGWGADGLLRAGPAPSGSGAAFTFELRNADGSEAEMSGNGLRCLAHAALDEAMVTETSFAVLTPAGGREVQLRPESVAQPGQRWGSTSMGSPKVVAGDEQRCNVGHGQLLVDVGNPHLVVLGPDPATVDVARLGPELEAGDPAGLNVEFVALGPRPDEVTMRVWERGVGETQACGTGSVAAALALHHWGRVGTRVAVHQPGGSVDVELRGDGVALLTGPSQRVGACDWVVP